MTKNYPQKNLVFLQQCHSQTAKELLSYLQQQREEGQPILYEIATEQDHVSLVKRNVDSTHVIESSAIPLDQDCLDRLAKIKVNPPGFIVMYTVGLGRILHELAPLLNQSRILLIEPDYEVLFCALQVGDWETMLRSPNLMFLAGEKWSQQAESLLMQYGSLLVSSVEVFSGSLSHDKTVTQELETLKAHVPQSQSTFHSMQQTDLQPEPETLGFASTNEHKGLTEILCTEAEQCGYQARDIFKPKPYLPFVRTDDAFWESAGRPLPATLLSFSHRVYSTGDWQRFKHHGVRRLVWCYDDPFRMDYHAMFENVDEIFCFDPVLSERLQQETSTPVRNLPCATSFSDGFSGGEDPDLGSLDVTFVGSTGLQRFGDPVLKMVAQRHKPFVELQQRVFSILKQGNYVQYDDLFSWGIDFSIADKTQRLIFLEDLTTYLIRLFFLASLGGKPLAVFGDKGWGAKHYAGPVVQYYRGKPLHYLSELPWVYHHSKINLNTFNVQCVNSPTIRMFDAMACGGFLLTEYRPFMDSMFVIGEEMDVFRSVEELRDKIDYYLANPEKRKAIAEAGREKVLREHRYRHRIQSLADQGALF